MSYGNLFYNSPATNNLLKRIPVQLSTERKNEIEKVQSTKQNDDSFSWQIYLKTL